MLTVLQLLGSRKNLILKSDTSLNTNNLIYLREKMVGKEGANKIKKEKYF